MIPVSYFDYLKDSFLIEEALRYDVKGRKHIGTENKYYFADIGIRAAILNFRQQEETNIMENIIYNELRSRGYNVDVGLVEIGGKNGNGKFVRRQLEVDFVVNRPPYRAYIQSAFHIPTSEKEDQERRPLLSINDHFRKIVIVGDDIHRKEDDLWGADCWTIRFPDGQELIGTRVIPEIPMEIRQANMPDKG